MTLSIDNCGLHRCGARRETRLYSKHSISTTTASGGSSDAPVAPVGLAGRRHAQIEAVIDQLTREGCDLPYPFSERKLYRTAADIGIPVWNPPVKERVTDRVLDRLNYERDPDSRAFAPVIGEQCVADIKRAARTITSALDANVSAQLRNEVETWCQLHGVESVDSETARTMVARQAILNALLQETLAECSERQAPDGSASSEIRIAGQDAPQRQPESVASETVLDRVADLADETTLAAVRTHAERLLHSPQPAEDIGWLYEALTPKACRQVLGQFRTPPPIADLLRRWASDGSDVVLDPGIGPAALSRPTFTNWKVSSEPDYVYGIDQSPLSRLMGTVTLTLTGQEHCTKTADFLSLAPAHLSENVDAIVCNPPYTQYNDLPSEYRATVNEQTEQLTGHSIPEKTPLYGYFLYHAAACLSPGDRMAVVVPHHFLHRQYGTALKQHLLDNLRIHGLTLYDPTKQSQFDNADTTALLLFLEATDQETPSGTTCFIHADNANDTDWYEELRTEDPSSQQTGVEHVEQTDLRPEAHWFRQVDPLTIDTANLTQLADIATVSRGILTGDNAFFCLSRHDVEKYGIDEQYLTPLIRTVSEIDGYEFRNHDWDHRRRTGEEAWLLDPDVLDDVPPTLDEAKATRDSWGVTDGTHAASSHPAPGLYAYLQANISDITSQTIKNNPPWYRVEQRDSAQILIQNLSRDGFDAIINHTEAVNLNNGNSITLDDTVAEHRVKALAAFLNSSAGDKILRHHAEIRTDGAYRLTPGALADVEVIDPQQLTASVAHELAESFDKLASDAIKTGDVVDRIDAVLDEHVL